MIFLLLLGMSACSQYQFYTQQQVDFFEQLSRNTVDILLVVDNSCSMIEEQTKLADNFEGFIQYFEQSESDYQIASVTTDTVVETAGQMLGGDDEIMLRDATGSLIDGISYSRNWSVSEGAAMTLSTNAYDSGDNDKQESWCLATETYGAGDLGSPGSAGLPCSSGAAMLPPKEPDDTGDTPSDPSPRTPVAGEVIITEFMADPGAVADELGEWIELYNVTDQTLILDGCTLEDIGRNFFTFPEGLEFAPESYLVVARSADSAVNGGVDAQAELGGDFTLQNNIFLLTNETEGAAEIFSEMVAVGITGSGLEMGLEAGRIALSDPLINAENAGFLREDANLSLIFVSDEDDMSPYSLDDYQSFFTEVKGEEAYRDRQRMKISAVVGDQPPAAEGQPSCSSSNGAAVYGSRYVELVSRTEGQLESICDEDFSQLAEDLGLLISGLSVEFVLSSQPDESTLAVALYETNDDESLIAELTPDIDYSYVVDRNAIRFVEDQVPAPGTWIRVEYDLAAEGTQQVDEGETQ